MVQLQGTVAPRPVLRIVGQAPRSLLTVESEGCMQDASDGGRMDSLKINASARSYGRKFKDGGRGTVPMGCFRPTR